MATIGFSLKAVQLPSAILNVKELVGKYMTAKLLVITTIITLNRSQLSKKSKEAGVIGSEFSSVQL